MEMLFIVSEAWHVWLLAAVGLFILEIFTPGFVLACFGLGALAASIPAMIGLSWAWQLSAFAIGSLLSLLFLRRIIRRWFSSKQEVQTGVDALIGRRAYVRYTGAGDESYSEISLDGDVWRVRSHDGSPLRQGMLVEVLSYESLILLVREVES